MRLIKKIIAATTLFAVALTFTSCNKFYTQVSLDELSKQAEKLPTSEYSKLTCTYYTKTKETDGKESRKDYTLHFKYEKGLLSSYAWTSTDKLSIADNLVALEISTKIGYSDLKSVIESIKSEGTTAGYKFYYKENLFRIEYSYEKKYDNNNYTFSTASYEFNEVGLPTLIYEFNETAEDGKAFSTAVSYTNKYEKEVVTTSTNA